MKSCQHPARRGDHRPVRRLRARTAGARQPQTGSGPPESSAAGTSAATRHDEGGGGGEGGGQLAAPLAAAAVLSEPTARADRRPTVTRPAAPTAAARPGSAGSWHISGTGRALGDPAGDETGARRNRLQTPDRYGERWSGSSAAHTGLQRLQEIAERSSDERY